MIILIFLQLEDEYVADINLSFLPCALTHLSFTSCEIELPCLSECANKYIHLQSLTFKRCPCVVEKHLRAFGKLEKLKR